MNNNGRQAELERVTSETDIKLSLNLDGAGTADVDSGVPFFDHMLISWALHSGCDLKLKAAGDLNVDDHHTVEDVGICLGSALKTALGDKKGIRRYGEATVPMDESLVRTVVDLSGRPYLFFDLLIPTDKIGSFSSENVEEFFRALVNQAGMTVHVDLIRGRNAHHIVEAAFKSLARALRAAVSTDERAAGILSAKGTL